MSEYDKEKRERERVRKRERVKEKGIKCVKYIEKWKERKNKRKI